MYCQRIQTGHIKLDKRENQTANHVELFQNLQGTIFFKFFKSKKLKGKIIGITENFAGHQMSILNEARERFDFMNVWTDGFK